MDLLDANILIGAFRPDDVNDAYIAATAAEARCRLVSLDGGFGRFPGLDWWNPAPIEEAENE